MTVHHSWNYHHPDKRPSFHVTKITFVYSNISVIDHTTVMANLGNKHLFLKHVKCAGFLMAISPARQFN